LCPIGSPPRASPWNPFFWASGREGPTVPSRGPCRPLSPTAPMDCWGGRPHGIACQNWGCEQPKPEPSMTQYKRIGIDTSKAVFTLHGIDRKDRPVLRINLRRAQMISFFRNLPPTVIALEACGGSHYWARELTAFGHTVRLIPPQYVKP